MPRSQLIRGATGLGEVCHVATRCLWLHECVLKSQSELVRVNNPSDLTATLVDSSAMNKHMNKFERKHTID